MRINCGDAEARGIGDGDLVEIRNDRGAIIAGAVLSDDIMPGVMSLCEGVWPDMDSKGRCNSGQINGITSERPASGLTQATIAFCRSPRDPGPGGEPPARAPRAG